MSVMSTYDFREVHVTPEERAEALYSALRSNVVRVLGLTATQRRALAAAEARAATVGR